MDRVPNLSQDVLSLRRPAPRSGRATNRFLRALASASVAVCSSVAGAQGVAAVTPAADVIPVHDTLSIMSRAVGEMRRINVYTPAAYKNSATAKFPVVYMPDGGIDEDFPHVVNTIDSLIRLREIRPVIVVGIPNTERRRDLTGPTRFASDSAIAKRVGGSGNFRKFIRDELIPTINARYRTSDERSIVGESAAGFFIVETFLLDPTLFSHYIAFDASLWWNKGALVESAAAQLKAFNAAPRSIHFSSSSEDIDALNTRFAGVLKSNAPKSLTWMFTPRTDLKHSTIFHGEGPVSLAKALR